MAALAQVRYSVDALKREHHERSREEAVVKALKVFGVREDQMEAVSWGEEKPADAAHTETAYAKNRRVEIVVRRRAARAVVSRGVGAVAGVDSGRLHSLAHFFY